MLRSPSCTLPLGHDLHDQLSYGDLVDATASGNPELKLPESSGNTPANRRGLDLPRSVDTSHGSPPAPHPPEQGPSIPAEERAIERVPSGSKLALVCFPGCHLVWQSLRAGSDLGAS